ncbi:MAG: IS110 family transposase [Candidatus Thermoplasmatota archaeon]|nr:IS110 family transposase [Candidatus Thermoplasmatota archaeon]
MNDNGNIIAQRNMENNIETVNGFLSVYKDHDIVIESSTSGKYLCKELLKLNYKIHLINPSKVPEISNNYKKTDKEDSFQLADVYRKGGMKEIYIPSGEIENIRSLVRYRHSLGEELTLKKNKIHALLTSYGIIIKATDPFGRKGLKEIESNYNNFSYSDKIVLRSLLNDISYIKDREKEIETEISLASSNNDNIKILMSIPGINIYTAAGILSEIGTINRFLNKEKFASYTGLIPGEYSSGERIIKGHITKHGPSLLRFFLVETVHSLIKYTRKFKSKYLSIVRRLGKKRSIIAIARILAETIYAMLKNNVKFVDRERKEIVNPDELYFKRLEELSLKKINNMRRIANNANKHGDSANLKYNGGIKDC